jgi:hypothetical protein
MIISLTRINTIMIISITLDAGVASISQDRGSACEHATQGGVDKRGKEIT